MAKLDSEPMDNTTQHQPLCVSVYSSDLDAILVLNFNKDSLVARRFKNYPVGAKLIAVNVYASEAPSGTTDGVELDIIEGPNSSKMWKSFVPYIIDFVIEEDDKPLLKYWVAKFSKEDWDKTLRLTHEYWEKYPGAFRQGAFMYHAYPTLDFTNKFYPNLDTNQS